MSRAAEEAAERRHRFLISYFVPGATVWRAESHLRGEWEIREGEVVEAERVSFSSLTQSFSPDPDGEYLRWRAKFPSAHGQYSWFRQTCEHEFYASRGGALRRLAWETERHAEDLEREASRQRAMLARIEQAILAEAAP